MDEFDEIPADVEAGSVSYWKHRARQWQRRCQRAESEKTELIEEIARLQAAIPTGSALRRAAVRSGDVSPGLSAPPRGF